jgi:hypothetical protein
MAPTLTATIRTTQSHNPLDRVGVEQEREAYSKVAGGHLFTTNVPASVSRNVTPASWLVEEDEIYRWVAAAMRHVATEVLEEGDVAAYVPGARGAWVDAPTESAARAALPDVLFDWASMKLGHGDIPIFDGININPR